MIKFRQKKFSVKPLNKYDLYKILYKSGTTAINFGTLGGLMCGISSFIQGLLIYSIEKLGTDNLTISGKLSSPREDFNNIYLESVLKRLKYVEGFHYTVGESNSDINMSLISGLFLLTVTKKSDIVDKIDTTVYNKDKSNINRTDTGKAIIYTYPINIRNNFDYLIKRLMSNKLTPNIFEG